MPDGVQSADGDLKKHTVKALVLEKTLESPLDCKEIHPVHSEGDQPWDFFGRNDAKAEAPVLWPPHEKSWLIGKDSDAGRDWGQEEKGTTEDEMAGWHHGLDGCESEWTLGVGDGQGGLACCSHGVAKNRIWLNDWTELNWRRKAWVSDFEHVCPFASVSRPPAAFVKNASSCTLPQTYWAIICRQDQGLSTQGFWGSLIWKAPG